MEQLSRFRSPSFFSKVQTWKPFPTLPKNKTLIIKCYRAPIVDNTRLFRYIESQKYQATRVYRTLWPLKIHFSLPFFPLFPPAAYYIPRGSRLTAAFLFPTTAAVQFSRRINESQSSIVITFSLPLSFSSSVTKIDREFSHAIAGKSSGACRAEVIAKFEWPYNCFVLIPCVYVCVWGVRRGRRKSY